MPIIRVQKHTSPYVIIEKTGLDDTRLSFCARGILAYLISKPDDWSISYKQLEQHSPSEGRRAIANAMQELLDAGYASRTRERGERGRMEGWVTTIYENPTAGASTDRHTASGQSVTPASLLAQNAPSTSLADPTDIPLTDSRKAVSLPRNDLTKKERARARKEGESARARRRAREAPPLVPLAADFGCTEAMKEWAQEHTPHLDLEAEHAQFLARYVGTTTRRQDWVVTWRSWMQHAQSDQQQHATTPEPTLTPLEVSLAKMMHDYEEEQSRERP